MFRSVGRPRAAAGQTTPDPSHGTITAGWTTTSGPGRPTAPGSRLPARGPTILLYAIPLVVIGENRTCLGGEGYLRSRGVEVVSLDSEACVALMREFIAARPDVWDEEVGKETAGPG